MQKEKPSVLVVAGPTASGKSDIAVELARELDGEVISADSRQVYEGLDIGTGKITEKEKKGIPHHLLDVADPRFETFSAGDFTEQGREAISAIVSRGKLPIIAGGTGFYIDALVGRITLPNVLPNRALRDELEAKTAEELYEMLKKKDFYRAQQLDPNNKVRLIRALEIISVHGHVPAMRGEEPYSVCWVGIDWPDEELKERIAKRLKKRMRAGMVAEALDLYTRGLTYAQMEDLGLEYRSLARYLQHQISREEMVDELESEIWRYVKRQRTYWKKNEDIKWFKPPKFEKILRYARKCLGK